MKYATIFLAVVGIGCGGPPGTVEAPIAVTAKRAYTVRFTRPSRVGERSHLVSDRSEDMATKINRDGSTVSDKHDRHVVHYDAVSTVVAIDSQGRPTRIHYDVNELAADGQRLQASVIEVTRHAKKKDAEIVVDGRPASEDVRRALASLLKLALDGATDDDVFGTKAPQPLGAHWGIDGALAAAAFKEDGVDVSAVTGEVWLDGTTHTGGAECLAVRATLDVRGMQVPNLPAGSELLESHAEVEMRAALPVDGGAGRPADHQSTTTSFRVRVPGAEGAPMMVTVEGRQTHDAHEIVM
jgi:hypothetical protein